MSNGLDPDKDRCSIGPDLGPNCFFKCYQQTTKVATAKERVNFSSILQVNGHDFTVVTHKKAVEYIQRKPVLNMLVYRKGVPQLPRQDGQAQFQSYSQNQPQEFAIQGQH